MKRIAAFLLVCIMLTVPASADYILDDVDSGEVDAAIFQEPEDAVAQASDIDIAAPSAILIEKETGKVLYEKNADEQLEPASVTKVMTILLIAEAIDSGAIKLDDMVPVSAYAASMGGSQIFLEEGEQMSVHDMLKSIVVSSANDAAVAMAEYIAGTESAFVVRMNERAAELGMTNTMFCNCTGLLDQPEHVTTARDISIMSRELLKHGFVRQYTTIWMDTVRNGEFGLSNTNKLIYYYSGATGLKTGFTQSAGYCMSATAERDGVEYIAVVMHCESSNDRFESAKTLLNYAFANYTVTDAGAGQVLPPISVTLGKSEYVQPVLQTREKLVIEKSRLATLETDVQIEKSLTAPVEDGQQVGTLTVSEGGETLEQIPIVIKDGTERLTLGDIYLNMLKMLIFGQ